MKKIGITCYPTVGGSGVIATELGKRMAKLGHEIHFITSSIPFRLDRIYPKIYYHEVEVGHYPVFQYPPYDLTLASKMAEVIDREELDILHVHYAMPHAICAILAKEIAQHDVKIVTTLHGTDITVLGIDPIFKKMIKHGIEQSDAVTAVSHSLVKQTKEMLSVQKDIRVIYNFVDENIYTDKSMPALKRQYGINPEEKVLIHISNFTPVKRITDIIYTFQKINQEVPSKLLLVGDGPDYAKAIQLSEKLGLKDHVLFLGKQNNILDLLSISDLKLLLSEKESFGLVLLEAMSSHVPCIVTNVGGIPEVILHGETGYIVNIGDTQSASQYAVRLLRDDTLLQRFKDASHRHVLDAFHSTEIVNEYMQLYDQLIQ